MPEFFGAIDRTKDGKIASEYPAWTFPRQIENATEEINSKQRALDGGWVPRESEGEYKIAIEREKKRLEDIEKSRPKLSDAEKDNCAKAYKDLTDGIQKSMPTHFEMHRNYVDAHEENRRNSNPCIKVNGKTAQLAEENGININSNGEMSRTAASKLAKIIGHALGENTNMERLRREGGTGRMKYMR